MRPIHILLFIFCSMVMYSCTNNPNAGVNEQGMFLFSGQSVEMANLADLPDNIDPSAVLCYGRGFSAGRCINKEMEKGICMGLMLHGKNVVAVQIPCETITKDSSANPIIIE